VSPAPGDIFRIEQNAVVCHATFLRSTVHENRRKRSLAGHVRASGCAQMSDGRGRGRNGRTIGEHVRIDVSDAEDYLFDGSRRSAVQVSVPTFTRSSRTRTCVHRRVRRIGAGSLRIRSPYFENKRRLRRLNIASSYRCLSCSTNTTSERSNPTSAECLQRTIVSRRVYVISNDYGRHVPFPDIRTLNVPVATYFRNDETVGRRDIRLF